MLKTIGECIDAFVADIEQGMTPCESLGLAPLRPGMYVDPRLCECGGGCESLLECSFWYYVRKTEEKERHAARQVDAGYYRLDSLFQCGQVRVAVELDGKQFHDAAEDWQRDKWILSRGFADEIIRIPFAAMNYYPQATFSVLGNWHPRFALRDHMLCMTVAEFEAERHSQSYSNGDYRNERDWVESVEGNYELWSESGWVGSPKAYLYRWNVTPIRRFVAAQRDRDPYTAAPGNPNHAKSP